MKDAQKQPSDGEQLQTPAKKKKSYQRFMLELLCIMVVALGFRHFVAAPALVQGNSMLPTLRPWDVVIENRWALRTGELERGMIVVLDPPGGEGREFIKRIIGLPGDVIRIADGRVYVNGTLLEEPYVDSPTHVAGEPMELTVPPDAYFVLGDNRAPNKSNDSRLFGPVARTSIKGIASFRYFPFGEPFGPL